MLRFSTGLRNSMFGLGRATISGIKVANTISFDAATSEIRDSGSGLITAGFRVGDAITARNTASNNTIFTVTALVAGAATVTPAPTDEAAGTVFALVAAAGGQLRDVLRDGKLLVYSGAQPATADAAVTGTLLGSFTESGGEWVAGSPANGLNFSVAASGIINKAPAETWKMTGVAAGSAGYFRFIGNPADSGAASTTLPRVDGSIGTTVGSDMQLVSTSITVGGVYYINNLIWTFPYQYGA